MCDGKGELLAIADERLRATGRELTLAERERYLD